MLVGAAIECLYHLSVVGEAYLRDRLRPDRARDRKPSRTVARKGRPAKSGRARTQCRGGFVTNLARTYAVVRGRGVEPEAVPLVETARCGDQVRHGRLLFDGP
ncbi:hypothetical protein GCM10027259_23480 [Micromonospora palomenae]